VKIRPERDGEQAAVWKINQEAFGRAVEADLVDAIRASDRFVPELSLVAEDGGKLIGHVLLSYVRIEPGGHPVLQLGPLAVLPSHQGRGVGSALMRHALRASDARKEPLILIEGNPRYYGKFGFERSTRAGIEPPPGVNGEYFMARTLTAHDPALRGQAIYSDAFLAAS
jgi:putative acetyltransferase